MDSRELAWARRRARRLVALGSALTVAVAACIVAVARPWAESLACPPTAWA